MTSGGGSEPPRTHLNFRTLHGWFLYTHRLSLPHEAAHVKVRRARLLVRRPPLQLFLPRKVEAAAPQPRQVLELEVGLEVARAPVLNRVQDLNIDLYGGALSIRDLPVEMKRVRFLRCFAVADVPTNCQPDLKGGACNLEGTAGEIACYDQAGCFGYPTVWVDPPEPITQFSFCDFVECWVSGAKLTGGGALYVLGTLLASDVTVQRCHVSANFTGRGGAFWLGGGGEVHISRTLIDGCYCAGSLTIAGGGIAVWPRNDDLAAQLQLILTDVTLNNCSARTGAPIVQEGVVVGQGVARGGALFVE